VNIFWANIMSNQTVGGFMKFLTALLLTFTSFSTFASNGFNGDTLNTQNVIMKMQNNEPVYYLSYNGQEQLLTPQMIEKIAGEAVAKAKKYACIYKPEKVSVSVANFTMFWSLDKIDCNNGNNY